MLPKHVPELFTKSYPDLTRVGVDKRRVDDAERRGAHHSSIPYQRGEEPEPYVSGATTSAGATDAARIDEGTADDDGMQQYPRGRRRPRDNQSVGKCLDIHISGRDVHARTIACLAAAFPHKADALRSIGKGCKEIVIEGQDCHAKVRKALSHLGGKVTHEP
jgi:hypothetical protein